MVNALIDQNCKWLANAENRELLKEYASIFVVGVDLKQREHDEDLALFCKNNNCDLLTADSTAHTHFFRVSPIKNVQISEFIYENKADRPIYLVKILT